MSRRRPPWEKPVPKTAFGYCVRCTDVPADPVYAACGDQRCADCYFKEVLSNTADEA